MASRTDWRTAAAVLAAVLVACAVAASARPQDPVSFTVVGKKYAFRVSGSDVAEIRVHKNDLVHITFSTDDIPHSFTIEAPYRIMRRAEPGKPVTFDFRADQVGRFPFFCNLKIDDGCKDMKGTLVVEDR